MELDSCRTPKRLRNQSLFLPCWIEISSTFQVSMWSTIFSYHENKVKKVEMYLHNMQIIGEHWAYLYPQASLSPILKCEKEASRLGVTMHRYALEIATFIICAHGISISNIHNGCMLNTYSMCPALTNLRATVFGWDIVSFHDF